MNALNPIYTLKQLAEAFAKLAEEEPIPFNHNTLLPEDELLARYFSDFDFQLRENVALLIQRMYGFDNLQNPFIVTDPKGHRGWVAQLHFSQETEPIFVRPRLPTSDGNVRVHYGITTVFHTEAVHKRITVGRATCAFDALLHSEQLKRLLVDNEPLSLNWPYVLDCMELDCIAKTETSLQHNFEIWLNHQMAASLTQRYRALSPNTQRSYLEFIEKS